MKVIFNLFKSVFSTLYECCYTAAIDSLGQKKKDDFYLIYTNSVKQKKVRKSKNQRTLSYLNRKGLPRRRSSKNDLIEEVGFELDNKSSHK